MNVLFFHRWTGVRGGGTETHLKGILKHLSDNHQVTLLTRFGPKLDYLKKEFPNLEIFTISQNLFENDDSYENPLLLYFHTAVYMLKASIKLLYLLTIKKIKVDVISIHFATEAIIAKLFRTLFNIPFVFVLEGYTDWEAKVAKDANAVISISKFISEKCEKKYGYYPEVIYIGEDNFPLVTEEVIKEKQKAIKKRVITVSRLEPRKNIKTAIDTIDYIIHVLKRTDIEFILGGTGILKDELLHQIKKLKLESTIKYIGYVPENEIVDLYQSAHIYFLPTFEEGFGIVFAEAMKSGAVVVSYDKTATPEIVSDAGILVKEAEDHKAYAEAIIKLVDDEELWLSYARKGLERAKDFDWKKLIPEYERKYQEAIESVKS